MQQCILWRYRCDEQSQQFPTSATPLAEQSEDDRIRSPSVIADNPALHYISFLLTLVSASRGLSQKGQCRDAPNSYKEQNVVQSDIYYSNSNLVYADSI